MAGTVKAYNLTPDYVLHKMSYVNLVMFNAVLPSYNRKKDKTTDKPQNVIKADDPRNKDKVRQFLNGIE